VPEITKVYKYAYLAVFAKLTAHFMQLSESGTKAFLITKWNAELFIYAKTIY